MKNPRCCLLAAFFLLGLSSLRAQVGTADSLVQRAFTSLKTKDEKAYLALFPDAERFSRITRTIMEQVLKSDAMQQIFAMDEKTKNINIDSLIMTEVTRVSSPEEHKAMQEKFVDAFQKTLQKGEAKGVKWSEAKLTGYTIDSTSVTDKEAEQFNLTGLKEAKGVIDFSVGEAAYQLTFGKMMLIPDEGGWFGIDFPQMGRKGESLATDAEASAADKEAATPPVKKPAAKAPATKKAPARKKA